MNEFADHFSRQAPAYASFRPSYPPSLVAAIAALVPARKLAWDCGTGNGQAARLVAEHFARVVATDASAEQLAEAPPHPRVEYRVARAEHSGLDAGSVDLVTAAAAAHWFDHARFHAEVDRVLVPGGVLAVWTYDPAHISPEIDRVLRWFQHERVAPYWPPGREHVDSGYTTLPFPYPPIALGPFAIENELDMAGLVGYASTWSATARCREKEGRDPIPELEARLAPLWPDARRRRPARWPLFLRVGRKPTS